jgi:hypothetical protein
VKKGNLLHFPRSQQASSFLSTTLSISQTHPRPSFRKLNHFLAGMSNNTSITQPAQQQPPPQRELDVAHLLTDAELPLASTANASQTTRCTCRNDFISNMPHENPLDSCTSVWVPVRRLAERVCVVIDRTEEWVIRHAVIDKLRFYC